jgi:hypothetical protein
VRQRAIGLIEGAIADLKLGLKIGLALAGEQSVCVGRALTR